MPKSLAAKRPVQHTCWLTACSLGAATIKACALMAVVPPVQEIMDKQRIQQTYKLDGVAHGELDLEMRWLSVMEVRLLHVHGTCTSCTARPLSVLICTSAAKEGHDVGAYGSCSLSSCDFVAHHAV